MGHKITRIIELKPKSERLNLLLEVVELIIVIIIMNLNFVADVTRRQ